MSRLVLVSLFLAAALAGCQKPGGAVAASVAASAPHLLLSGEDLYTVRLSSHTQGAVITGTLEPERHADLRAEISAVVLRVLRENGDSVRRGDLLVQLDDTAIRDSLNSAQESARAAGQAFKQSQRQFQRLETLQAQGMMSIQAAEDAEIRRNNARSDLAAANSRLVTSKQQVSRTEIRAPFDGIVSERKVSAGDTAQIGKELVKVMDPASLRLQGLVSADLLSEVRAGQDVSFRVNGYPQTEFNGKVKRVSAAANAITRQVEVLVEFAAGGDAPRMAGLYAEGRIASRTGQAMLLPEASIVKTGDTAHVWRLEGRALRKVEVRVGERDARRGDYVILGGLADGDQVLRQPGGSLVDGQQVEIAAGAAPGSALAPAAPADLKQGAQPAAAATPGARGG